MIGCLDPNPVVSSNSVSLLRKNNVDVQVGVLEKECEHLIRKFKTNLDGRPYIILKWAQSQDGYMGKKDKQVWISNQYSKVLVHKWRSEIDGIMVGTQTVISDNPSLTTREWEGDSPIRIVPDFEDRIPKSAKIFTDGYPTIILNQSKQEQVENIEYLNVGSKEISQYWKQLYTRGIYSILVEGGKQLLNNILESGLWDEARVITASEELQGGLRAPTVIGKLYDKQRLSGDFIVSILNEGS